MASGLKNIKLAWPRRVCILGSTGSVGVSALEVVRRARSDFEVIALCAGANAHLLAEQIKEFKPRFAALQDEKACKKLHSLLGKEIETEILCGSDEISGLAAHSEVDLVVAAVVGVAGLSAVIEAVKAGKAVALANKESLVVGGSLLQQLCLESKAAILPVDSEHSAIFQCLKGEREGDLAEIILTASGGPFFRTPVETFSEITTEQALRHPNWSMGAKITIDSATMMNKALEVIEAHWLFGVSAENIKVVVHPKSIIHSMIRLLDGSVLAQLGVPDMKGAISYAMRYPEGRQAGATEHLDLLASSPLEFFPLDDEKFPAVRLARECIVEGGVAAAVMNTANEVAVGAFLKGKLGFHRIVPLAAGMVERWRGISCSKIEELMALLDEVKLESERRVLEQEEMC